MLQRISMRFNYRQGESLPFPAKHRAKGRRCHEFQTHLKPGKKKEK